MHSEGFASADSLCCIALFQVSSTKAINAQYTQRPPAPLHLNMAPYNVELTADSNGVPHGKAAKRFAQNENLEHSMQGLELGLELSLGISPLASPHPGDSSGSGCDASPAFSPHHRSQTAVGSDR